VTEDSGCLTVESAGRMLCRVVLDTSRTRVRTFGSDDAGHLESAGAFQRSHPGWLRAAARGGSDHFQAI